MTQDKQLRGVSLDMVVKKRQLDQALNAKEFAVLAGVSYSTAREWFSLAGFPSFRGVVFWKDFELWRAVQTGVSEFGRGQLPQNRRAEGVAVSVSNLPPQAARIVAEFG